MKRALLSVSDKTGIIEFAKSLISFGYEILSTGGTKKYLDQNNIPCIAISEITEFPEIMDGRIKTLHPKIHGGILALRDNIQHKAEAQKLGIDYIDIVAVNLYPFCQTLKNNGLHSEIIENIDIGGPTMLRSAAKNYKFVTVIVDQNDYNIVTSQIEQNGNTSLETRQKLAEKVFCHTAFYDNAISKYFAKINNNTSFPEKLNLSFDLINNLRYGENPHQKAAFYKDSFEQEKIGYSLSMATKLQGKELSYNNIQDSDAALLLLSEFHTPTVVCLKHTNPCAVACDTDLERAWDKAFEADKTSIFGGVVAFNKTVTKSIAQKLSKIFLEIILAPDFESEALAILSKKKNLRLIKFEITKNFSQVQIKSINGGLLIQDYDNLSVDTDKLNFVSQLKPDNSDIENLIFAMKVCKHVKSNAITVVDNFCTCGIGAGQMNRVGAAKIALEAAEQNNKANNQKKLYLASDAFFPFDDTVKLAHQYGVSAIIQPGGSIHDEDSIKACNELGIILVFSGIRHFKH